MKPLLRNREQVIDHIVADRKRVIELANEIPALIYEGKWSEIQEVAEMISSCAENVALGAQEVAP